MKKVLYVDESDIALYCSNTPDHLIRVESLIGSAYIEALRSDLVIFQTRDDSFVLKDRVVG